MPPRLKPFTSFLNQGMQNTNQNINNMNKQGGSVYGGGIIGGGGQSVSQSPEKITAGGINPYTPPKGVSGEGVEWEYPTGGSFEDWGGGFGYEPPGMDLITPTGPTDTIENPPEPEFEMNEIFQQNQFSQLMDYFSNQYGMDVGNLFSPSQTQSIMNYIWENDPGTYDTMGLIEGILENLFSTTSVGFTPQMDVSGTTATPEMGDPLQIGGFTGQGAGGIDLGGLTEASGIEQGTLPGFTLPDFGDWDFGDIFSISNLPSIPQLPKPSRGSGGITGNLAKRLQYPSTTGGFASAGSGIGKTSSTLEALLKQLQG
jgi:hypothetical protein